MRKKSSVARDISYASSAKTKSGRAVIRTLENLTGRPRLIKRAEGYDREVALGADFWQVIMGRFDVELDFISGALKDIPKTGPLIVIANHPFGILDGMILGHILSQARQDFRIVANSVFKSAEDINKIILPISFDETREAMRINLKTRNTAIDYLTAGGCVGVFPGGAVSTSSRPMGAAMDPRWRNFTAKLIARTDATVVPVYFDGSNSRLFQLASHTHSTLRMALLIREFKKQIKHKVKLVVGDAIPAEELRHFRDDPAACMDFLRMTTYGLSPNPLKDMSYGYEFGE